MPPTLRYRVPPLACDCHMHVFGDPDMYPVSEIRSYTPREAGAAAWRDMAGPLGLQRVVVVQPSAYGADNRCVVDAISGIGPTARGVAGIDRLATRETLQALHDAGIRGVRLNPKANGVRDTASVATLIAETAELVAPLGWHLQLYIALSALPDLAHAIEASAAPVVLDHMGGARAGETEAALAPLLRLLGGGRCWVKLSGATRVSQLDRGFEDSTAIARALVDANAHRLVWGTDWPHTAGHGATPQRNAPQIAFRTIDNAVLLDRLADAAGSQSTFDLILQDNPARLYDF